MTTPWRMTATVLAVSVGISLKMLFRTETRSAAMAAFILFIVLVDLDKLSRR